jgi:hypothetical protein
MDPNIPRPAAWVMGVGATLLVCAGVYDLATHLLSIIESIP